MEKGGNKQLHLRNLVNPPIYSEIFIENGFYIKHIIDHYSVQFRYIDLDNYKFNFTLYEYINPEKCELTKYVKDVIKLHIIYLNMIKLLLILKKLLDKSIDIFLIIIIIFLDGK